MGELLATEDHPINPHLFNYTRCNDRVTVRTEFLSPYTIALANSHLPLWPYHRQFWVLTWLVNLPAF